MTNKADTKESKKKTRVSYPKDLRASAKELQHGVATVHIEFPNGERLEAQGTLGLQQMHFLRWAAAMIFCREVSELPNLETTVRQLMEKQ